MSARFYFGSCKCGRIGVACGQHGATLKSTYIYSSSQTWWLTLYVWSVIEPNHTLPFPVNERSGPSSVWSAPWKGLWGVNLILPVTMSPFSHNWVMDGETDVTCRTACYVRFRQHKCVILIVLSGYQHKGKWPQTNFHTNFFDPGSRCQITNCFFRTFVCTYHFVYQRAPLKD